MNSHLFNRSLGATSPQAFQQAETTRLLYALQFAPNVQYDSRNDNEGEVKRHASKAKEEAEAGVWAHPAGVNCLEIDVFEGRYLLSGGADASIHLWDLEEPENTSQSCLHRPLGTVRKSSSSHKFGITKLSFYPFDSDAFLSSSYDHYLKIYSTQTLEVSASFDLNSVVYSHASSPVAGHLLVACATQHPAVRLVDLRSGASAHSLAGHSGAVLSVAWSPHEANVLATAGSDGTVRLWDIRRSAGCLGLLDLEDSVGTTGDNTLGRSLRPMDRRKAHVGACNGVAWTDEGDYLITTGHDERIRVWSTATGANALSHFGPTIKNANLSTLLPLLPPSYLAASGKQKMFYPNEKEILMFDLLEGTLHKRLKAPGLAVAQARGSTGQRNIRNRVASLAWRNGHIELYSAHSDGVIRTWMPRTKEDAEFEADNLEEVADAMDRDESRKRKREALDEVYRELTRDTITFR
ncbi:hypothetical protein MMC11_003905 [Xylographa trunciseda]|nr:hypothetical protein [Xylographa trunciseda]